MRLILVPFIVLLPIVSNAQKKAVDVFNLNSLSPDYKEVKVTVEKADWNVHDTTWIKEKVLTKKFDREGNCLTYEFKNLVSNTSVIQQQRIDREHGIITIDSVNDGNFSRVIKLNTAGKPVEVSEVNKKLLYTNTEITRYTYDSIGRLAQKIYTLNEGSSQRRTLYYYSDRGLPSKTLLSYWDPLDNRWEPNQDTVFHYDNTSKLIARAIHDLRSDGEVFRTDTCIFEYDGYGRVISEKASYFNFKEYVLRRYAYDMDGRLIAESTYGLAANDTLKLMSRNTYEYDGNGFLKKMTLETSQYLDVFEWRTAYNSEGLPLSTLFITPRSVTRYSWTYKKR